MVIRIIRIVLMIMVIITGSSILVLANNNCTIEVAADVTTIDGETINPGDVICLLPGNKDFLLLNNIQGTASQPITIINDGGAVVINTDHFYGIKFDNCKHVIFSGNGFEGEQYGIQIQRVAQGAGMSVDNKSTNIEIEYVEISYTAIAGIYAKTEPYQGDCNNLVTRDNFTMYDIKIHNCYLHDIADEGFYIGSSKYTGQIVYQCDEIVVLPHVIEGVEIYDNIIENTGWDGIQVSSSPVDCSIHDNIIRNDSYKGEYGQMSGILIGGGSKCDCYNNSIYDGKGDGIDVFGMGFMKIFNNLIVRPGRGFEPGNPTAFKSGIYVGYVPGAISPNATFKVYNNTIISPKSFGVTYNNTEAAMGYVVNNLITEPGYASVIGDDAFVNLMVSSDKVTQNNNFLSSNNTTPKFNNFGNDDYSLRPNSEAINFGTSLTTEGVTFDIDDKFRPFHTYFDAGAYESHDPQASVNEYFSVDKPYPVPTNNILNIPVSKHDGDIIITLTSMSGVIIKSKKYKSSSISGDYLSFNVSDIESGKYIINMHNKGKLVSLPIVIVK